MANKKIINIPNVTGDIIITFNAVAIDSGETEEPESIPCTGITLNKTTLTLNNLSNQIITATVTPSDTTDTITWSSDNEDVVVVTNGYVYPKGEGTCIITATCGNYSATCNVSIDLTTSGDSGSSSESIPCTGINIVEDIITSSTFLEKKQITVEVTPSNTTDDISYVVFDKTIAVSDSNGILTMIGNGETRITVYCGDYSDYATIVVNDTTLDDTVLQGFILDVEQPTTDSDYDGEIIITEKRYHEIICYPVPGSFLEQGTIYWSCYQPEILGIGTTTGTSQKVYPGKNGEATLTVSYDLGTEGYLRKRYKVIVAIEVEVEDVEILYDSPTIVMEGCKAKATQDGVTQYFDVSYRENPGYPGYKGYHTLTDERGLTHYLALVEKGSSPFGMNYTDPETGETQLLHLDSAGWYTLTSSQSGVEYKPHPSLLSWNNFDNWNCTIQNLNDSFPSELLEAGLAIFNQTLPGLNMTVDQNSTNTIELSEEVLDDTQPAFVTMIYSEERFLIYFNESQVEDRSGPYATDNYEWLSTTVHELGHTLGPADEAAHLPSLYDYGRPYAESICLQPNDIAYIKYMHKDYHDMDIQTYQEATNPLSISAQTLSEGTSNNELEVESQPFFAYIPYKNIEEHSDFIINGTLEYVENRVINISHTRILELEYRIYNIIDIDNQLIDKQLKIPKDALFNPEPDKVYKLYLKHYDNVPYSLVDLYEGFEAL